MQPHTRPIAPVALILAAALASVLAAPPALARAAPKPPPPPNDAFAQALVVTSFPDTRVYDMALATLEAGEPNSWYAITRSVWYQLRPTTTMHVHVAAASDSYQQIVINLFQGTSLSNLSELRTSTNGEIMLTLAAGESYHLRIGTTEGMPQGLITVTLDRLQPPANDNFADATPIAAVPFATELSVAGATVEADEPRLPCGSTVSGTVWFSFTAPESRLYAAEVRNIAWNNPLIAIYASAGGGSLAMVGSNCGQFPAFQATAGLTYYFQIGEMMGEPAMISLSLYAAPDPTIDFIYRYPSDPSIFDDISFSAGVTDPVGQPVKTWGWDFGDGKTSQDMWPTHRYAADGDYTVTLTVTMNDGRTAHASQAVAVRTHDVAITKFSVPQTASLGQTRSIIVSLNNPRDEVVVKVYLYKNDANYADQSIGQLTLTVPPRQANRTTNFTFSYTFTREDATVGKVTFKAYAEIQGGRDVLPQDNNAIAPPTRVTR